MAPSPGSLPGKPQGRRSLAGYSPWGLKELDIIEATERNSSTRIGPSLLVPAVMASVQKTSREAGRHFLTARMSSAQSGTLSIREGEWEPRHHSERLPWALRGMDTH